MTTLVPFCFFLLTFSLVVRAAWLLRQKRDHGVPWWNLNAVSLVAAFLWVLSTKSCVRSGFVTSASQILPKSSVLLAPTIFWLYASTCSNLRCKNIWQPFHGSTPYFKQKTTAGVSATNVTTGFAEMPLQRGWLEGVASELSYWQKMWPIERNNKSIIIYN